MVFQSTLNIFNPVLRIWEQFRDTALAHDHGGVGLRERVSALLRFVHLGRIVEIGLTPRLNRPCIPTPRLCWRLFLRLILT